MDSGTISPGAPTGTGPKANVVACRIDDRDLDALDALVEAGIRSTRSDAASWLIHAGIETHSDLFKRVYATVAQIRQLRSEAQLMAQEVANEAAKAQEETPTEAAKAQEETEPTNSRQQSEEE